MNSENFVIWLSGFLHGRILLHSDEIDAIQEKIKEVQSRQSHIPNIVPRPQIFTDGRGILTEPPFPPPKPLQEVITSYTDVVPEDYYGLR